MPLLDERRPWQVGDRAGAVGGERPERQVQQEAEEIAGHRPVAGQHQHFDSSAAARQQPGSHAHPGGAEHLVRQPRTDPASDQRRGEQSRAPEGEPEPGPEDAPGEHQDEEHRLQARGAGAQWPQRCPESRQHPEHRHGLGVDASVGELREHHRQHQDQQCAEHDRGCQRCRQPARGDHERPPECDQADQRGPEDREAGAGGHHDRGREPATVHPAGHTGVGAGHGATCARTWPTVR